MLGTFLRGAGSVLPSIEYITAADVGDSLTTYTFSSQSIGEPSADRLVIVGATGFSFSSRTLSSATIGGTSATIHIGTGISAQFAGGIFSRSVPFGTTTDITVTFSGGMSLASIFIWVGRNFRSDATVGTGTATGSDNSVTLTTSAGGVGVGVARFGGGTSVTWTGLTGNVGLFGDTSVPASAASGSFSGLSQVIRANASVSSSRLIVASWR